MSKTPSYSVTVAEAPPPGVGGLRGIITLPDPSWACTVAVVRIAGKQVLADGNCAYLIRDIPAGTYTAECARVMCKTAYAIVTIVAGQGIRKDWVLERA